MKIIQLDIENIKKIKAISIKPSGNVTTFAGNNCAGKTSTLDSIMYALAGSRVIPKNPVRDGQKTAEIRLDLGDYVVTRNWTESGNSYLKITTKEGVTLKAGQDLLNGLIGDLAFDPMEFASRKPSERVDILKRIAKIDFSGLDKERDVCYSDRTFINREIKNLQGELVAFKDVQEVQVPDIESIKIELKEAMAHNNEIDESQRQVARLKESITQQESFIARMRSDLAKAEEAKANLQKQFDELEANVVFSTKTDTKPLEEKIANNSEIAVKSHQWKRKVEIEARLSERQNKVQELTNRIDDIDREKESTIENAKMPIKGLSFKDGDVSFNGVEFSSISSAQQIKVSMAIAMSLNPKLKIVRIMNGSLIDENGMAEIAKIAQKMDYQVFVERVQSKPDGNSIFIHDGEVLES